VYSHCDTEKRGSHPMSVERGYAKRPRVILSAELYQVGLNELPDFYGSMAESKELTVACMCNAATHTFSVPTSSLPIATHLCSCNISRRISGALLTSYFNVTHGSNPPKPNLCNFTPYKSSDILTRHFCTTCGTQMYVIRRVESQI
jgi:hypothetical protein